MGLCFLKSARAFSYIFFGDNESHVVVIKRRSHVSLP